MEFKNFTKKIHCRVIPMTRDKLVWLNNNFLIHFSYYNIFGDLRLAMRRLLPPLLVNQFTLLGQP